MTDISEILNKISPDSFPSGICNVELGHAAGRVLREDIKADMPMPPFDKAAMDGYACRRADLSEALHVVETIPAGKWPEKKIEPRTCAKIMTGAAVPEGADCVFMVEYADERGAGTVSFTGTDTKNNICYLGEDYREGTILVPRRTLIQPSHIGTMASAGYTQVATSCTPRVAIMATGTELTEVSEKPGKGKIRNSNSPQLIAQLQQMGIEGRYFGIVPDDFDAINRTVEQSLENNDILIVSGGASEGDYDFIFRIMEKQKFSVLTRKTGMKPGNPMLLGQKGKQFCFGLSGNPVSSFVQFTYFVKPFLYTWQHTDWQPSVLKARLKEKFVRKKTNRFAVVPVLIDSEGLVSQVGFHGSAHINALTLANAFMEVPEGIGIINEGGEVYVRPF